MTKEEKLIVGAYTGFLMCDWDDLHKFIEDTLGRPVWTHELADDKVNEEIRLRLKPRFLAICAAREESSQPRWIPVTEKLPDAHKEVYVTDGEYIARANLLDEVFPGDQPCWSYSGIGEITHWCEKLPLPEPPKEGHA